VTHPWLVVQGTPASGAPSLSRGEWNRAAVQECPWGPPRPSLDGRGQRQTGEWEIEGKGSRERALSVLTVWLLLAAGLAGLVWPAEEAAATMMERRLTSLVDQRGLP